MSPLSKSTIATVGSGVMAEAMIAGLLRGGLVDPARSSPAIRAPSGARRWSASTASGPSPRNADAVRDADVILLGIKPQMLGRVGRDIGPHLRRGQLVLSVLAGATTAALTGILGHDQVVRSMPNTPARLGKGVTVWYATPETTETSGPRPPPCSARSASSSRSTTRRWSRWRPPSAAPARPTCSS